jgi:hypothetical protein
MYSLSVEFLMFQFFIDYRFYYPYDLIVPA